MPRRKRSAPAVSPEKLSKIEHAERSLKRDIERVEARIALRQSEIEAYQEDLAALRAELERISAKRG